MPPALKIIERERAAILSSLAAGVVPRIGLQHVQVDRKEEVAALIEDLKRVESGGSAVRFVAGRFGTGKSFLLNLIRAVALERKFVVVQADITTDRRLQATGGAARALYSELMKNLCTRGKPEGGALPNLVERWVGEVSHQVTAAGGNDQAVEAKLYELCKPLQDLVSGFDFVNVIAQYYRGYLKQDEPLQTAAVRWLRAEYATKTEARQDLGVRSIIDDASIYDYLKLFARFVRIAGFAGLLVCLDELVVLSHRLNNKIARSNNYEAILRIVNDCLQGAVEGLGFIFAATDDCIYDKRRGLCSYEALATRLADNRFASDQLVDLAGPVMKLKALTPEDCYVLLHNIRHVHAGGDQAKYAVPDECLTAYLASCNQRMGAASFQTPRETIKDWIGLLNVLQQNPGSDWKKLIGEIKTTAAPTVDPSVAAATADVPDTPPAGYRRSVASARGPSTVVRRDAATSGETLGRRLGIIQAVTYGRRTQQPGGIRRPGLDSRHRLRVCDAQSRSAEATLADGLEGTPPAPGPGDTRGDEDGQGPDPVGRHRRGQDRGRVPADPVEDRGRTDRFDPGGLRRPAEGLDQRSVPAGRGPVQLPGDAGLALARGRAGIAQGQAGG